MATKPKTSRSDRHAQAPSKSSPRTATKSTPSPAEPGAPPRPGTTRVRWIDIPRNGEDYQYTPLQTKCEGGHLVFVPDESLERARLLSGPRAAYYLMGLWENPVGGVEAVISPRTDYVKARGGPIAELDGAELKTEHDAALFREGKGGRVGTGESTTLVNLQLAKRMLHELLRCIERGQWPVVEEAFAVLSDTKTIEGKRRFVLARMPYIFWDVFMAPLGKPHGKLLFDDPGKDQASGQCAALRYALCVLDSRFDGLSDESILSVVRGRRRNPSPIKVLAELACIARVEEAPIPMPRDPRRWYCAVAQKYENATFRKSKVKSPLKK